MAYCRAENKFNENDDQYITVKYFMGFKWNWTWILETEFTSMNKRIPVNSNKQLEYLILSQELS